MKRTATIVCLVSLSLGAASAQKVNLRFSTWAGGNGLALLQSLAKEYGEKNKDVQVSVEVTPFADYGRKLAIQIASGDAPDVGWLAERDVPTFIANKSLTNLAPSLSDKTFNLADFPLSTLGLFKRGSAVYGVPFSNSPLVLFYNKDLFQKAGIPDPLALHARGQWDYAAYQAAAKTIKDKTGAVGARLMRVDLGAWESGTLALLWSHGGGPFDKNFKCTLNSPGSLRGFQLMHDMMFKDASMPRPGDQTTFAGGNIGMYSDNVSYSAQLSQVPFKWAVAPMPKGPAGRITQLGQAGYVVLAKGAHQKEAVEFLKYLASPEIMARTAQFYPPPRVSILKSSAYLSGNPLVPGANLKTALVNQLPSARVFQTDTNYLRVSDAISTGLQRLFQPNADLKATLDDLCRQVNGL